MCSNVDDFNNRNIFDYIGLNTILHQGISKPIFYGDLIYNFKKIVGEPNFCDQFKKIIKRIKNGYNLDITCKYFY